MDTLGLALLGILIVIFAVFLGREGFYAEAGIGPAGSSSSQTAKLPIKDGLMAYVYDSRKMYSRTNNWVARVIEANSRASDVSGMKIFQINATSGIGIVMLDMDKPEYEILRPVFPNSMGIYVTSEKNSILFNSYFGMDRINNEADAKKIINAIFVAKGDAELAATLSQQLGLYVERRNDMPTVDALMLSIYKGVGQAGLNATV
jgi:hypothetical protein